MRIRTIIPLALATFALTAISPALSQAADPPFWHLTSAPRPTVLQPEAKAELSVAAANLGATPATGETEPIVIADSLPPGLEAKGVEAIVGSSEESPIGKATCTLPSKTSASCSFPGSLPPFEQIEVRIKLKVLESAVSGEVNEATASGGGAAAAALSRPIAIGEEPARFGLEDFELGLEEPDGSASLSAGSHPFQFTTTLAVNQATPTIAEHGNYEPHSVGLTKQLGARLPVGVLGNPLAAPRCTLVQFLTPAVASLDNKCPPQSAVGVARVSIREPLALHFTTLPVPLFNLEPEFGEPARFGFALPNSPVLIDTALRDGGPGEPHPDYGVTATAHNVDQAAEVIKSEITIWGTPGDPAHSDVRGWGCLEETRGFKSPNVPCEPVEEPTPAAFLTLPTSCSGPLQATAEAASWEEPANLLLGGPTFPLQSLTDCEALRFNPEIASSPTATAAASPSGLNFDLDFSQQGLTQPGERTESNIKKAVVALPPGITTNPAVAGGLSACTLAQYQEEAIGSAAGCPESSKVGEVEIDSPLVEPVIHGSIYVAKQHDNPADNLLSIYMVAKSPELGALVKSAGAVTPNPQNGQLSTTFDELPQLPFTHFHLSFRSGPRAPLITPGLCGIYTTGADLYPYSNPTVPLHRDATFEVSAGANGAPCVTQESQLPNKPSLEAGTLSPIAGAYSPLVFKVKREDGSQALSRVDATLPEGLLGKLAGVTECSNAQIAQAESRSAEGQGATELVSPSCPASSQVGVVTVGTGVGSQPYYVQGKAYLAGPYKGAPLSLAIITPAVVGPFDLGTIVVRTALYVNEATAQITAKSDSIPTIVHGLPTVVQSIALNMNRPNFTLNPTSCEPKQITGSAISTLGSTASLANHFQVDTCGALGFKPSLKLSLKGATKRSGVPALKAVLTYPKGNYANIKSVSTVLPKSEFIDNAHIGNTCTRVQFNAGSGQGAECPKRSVLGHATAYSPLLDKPLKGTVYLRSNGGERELPDIVAALKGQIPVTLVGFIDSVKKNKHSEVSRLRTRFMNVPDAPVSRFVLQLAGAKHGLLENSANLCRVKNIAQVKAVGQNGKTYDTTPAVANDCANNGKGKKKAKPSKRVGTSHR